MTKCGKSFLPECEYFTTGGCISPFNCSYRIEELSPNSATSISSSYVQNLISENAALKSENAKLRATISKMETVEKELTDRLKEAFEVPCLRRLNHNPAFYVYEVVYTSQGNGSIKSEKFVSRTAAEARLEKLKGEQK